MAMNLSPVAGKPAQIIAMLINVPKLITAYYMEIAIANNNGEQQCVIGIAGLGTMGRNLLLKNANK